MRVRKDRQGRVIERLGLVKEGKHANDLQLSIDQRVQALAYRALKRATDENKATSGSMVMLDVKTGEVLAMVNTPSYNPNNRGNEAESRDRLQELWVPLLSALAPEVMEITGATTQINYGANKVRFPSPVPVGSRIRLGVDLQGVVPVGGGMADIVYKFTTEVEGAIKPACVAEVIIRVIF
jgi:hypothetical protein